MSVFATLLLVVIFSRAWERVGIARANVDLAFTSDRGGKCCRIYVVSRGGRGVQPVSPTRSRSPSWSPDGSRLVFVRWERNIEGPDAEIYVMKSGGGDEKRLTHNSVRDDAPAWSPDGSSIAFVRDRGSDSDIYLMDADGGNERQLTRTPEPAADPAWSPDNRWIAFRWETGGWSVIAVVGSDGGNEHVVLKLPTLADSPTWSPDGRWIAFRQEKAIYRVRPDGTQLEKLFQADDWILHPAWSPDGKEIAFEYRLNGFFVGPDIYEIHSLDVPSRTERRITGGEGDFEPQWRPSTT